MIICDNYNRITTFQFHPSGLNWKTLLILIAKEILTFIYTFLKSCVEYHIINFLHIPWKWYVLWLLSNQFQSINQSINQLFKQSINQSNVITCKESLLIWDRFFSGVSGSGRVLKQTIKVEEKFKFQNNLLENLSSLLHLK